MSIQNHIDFVEDLAKKLGKENFTWKIGGGFFSSATSCSFTFLYHYLSFTMRCKIKDNQSLSMKLSVDFTISRSVLNSFIITDSAAFYQVLGKKEFKPDNNLLHSRVMIFAKNPIEMKIVNNAPLPDLIIKLNNMTHSFIINKSGVSGEIKLPGQTLDLEKTVLEVITTMEDICNNLYTHIIEKKTS